MSNFVFQFNADSLAVAAELTAALEMFTGATVGADNDHTSTIYHEVAASKAGEFLKFVHDLNEAPITDTDGNVQYLFNVLTEAPVGGDGTEHKNGLNDMIGDLKNWHVKENGHGVSATYSNHLPANSVPDQSGDDAARDVDNGSENKYPFSYKIVPMRVTAAYGSNLTDLLENEAVLQADADTQIDALKTNLLGEFGAHNEQGHDVSGAENYGKKILRQAINQAQGSTAKSDRLINMFKADGDNTSVNASGNQVTKFTFEADDEIKFYVSLKTVKPDPNNAGQTISSIVPQNLVDVDGDENADPQNTLVNNTLFNEPASYKFMAHLKFVPDFYTSIMYDVGGAVASYFMQVVAATIREDDGADDTAKATQINTWVNTLRTNHTSNNNVISFYPGNVVTGMLTYGMVDGDGVEIFSSNNSGTNATHLRRFSAADGEAADLDDEAEALENFTFWMKLLSTDMNGNVDLVNTKWRRVLYVHVDGGDNDVELGEIVGMGRGHDPSGNDWSLKINSTMQTGALNSYKNKDGTGPNQITAYYIKGPGGTKYYLNMGYSSTKNTTEKTNDFNISQSFQASDYANYVNNFKVVV